MIAFLTLLLGLISGRVPIEVTTGGPVSQVEILVDGIPGGTLSAPPWRTEIDLGTALEPHELMARALDSNGTEIARTVQWINLPRPPAEVEIVLENGPSGLPQAARMSWQSVNGAAPSRTFLSFDGRALPLDREGRATLPKHSLKDLHVLSAEAWFGPGFAGHRDVVFGGEYGSQISTELTAIPVRAPRRQAGTLTPARLQGRLLSAGRPLTVAAIEDGPARVVMVNVPGPSRVYKRVFWARPWMEAGSDRGAVASTFGSLDGIETEMRMGDDSEVRLISPYSRRVRGAGVAADLFDISRDFGPQDGGLLYLLAQTALETAPVSVAPRIADAVAVAGLQAAVENRRRAVVLLLSEGDEDSSRYTVAEVRRYLASIRVPLYVWSLYGGGAPGTASWGQAEDVSSVRKFFRAFGKLKGDLESQRIVWVEGRYLPQAVALTPGAGGIESLVPAASGTPRGAR